MTKLSARGVQSLLCLMAAGAFAQTVPTFTYQAGQSSYTLLGRDPAQGGTLTIPVALVPVSLSFESAKAKAMDATADTKPLLASPVFAPFALPGTAPAQYADAMLRTTFPDAKEWHTTLKAPTLMPAVTIAVPAAYGYVLTSKKSGRSLAVADVEYVQRELFKRVPKQDGQLVIAVTHNTTFYTEGDATICCSWGTHGRDAATGNSFVIASYLADAPDLVKDQDVQPLTEQLAEFVYDPLNDPLLRQQVKEKPGNRFPAWLRPASMQPGDQGPCGGMRVASAYFLLEPTDTNRKNNLPASAAFATHVDDATYHLQNVALLRWYLGAAGPGQANSFPDARALPEAAHGCAERRRGVRNGSLPTVQPMMAPLAQPNGHQLIGYWTGQGPGGAPFPLGAVSPQWDVIIATFATPKKDAPEGTLEFKEPDGLEPGQLQRDVADLKSRGKTVLLSLGGGGVYFPFDDSASVPRFVQSVEGIVKQYGFEGVDIDFESPSLEIAAGDTDFRQPKTPSIVNLIAGLRQLRNDLGPSFAITLVPEGPQFPAGHVTYGGQFGSFLPIAYALRDVLRFVDVQDYNTPPLEGLDGEIYQAGSVDYHAAVTELVLSGFDVGRDAQRPFPAMQAKQVAAGFLTGDATPEVVNEAMRYIIGGKRPTGVTYDLQRSAGYRDMLGAMFWNIDDDRVENYRFSNAIGPLLHGK